MTKIRRVERKVPRADNAKASRVNIHTVQPAETGPWTYPNSARRGKVTGARTACARLWARTGGGTAIALAATI